MFRAIIEESQFSQPDSDSLFPNINGDKFYGDCSFLTTLRAIMPERIGDGKISVRYTESYYNSSINGLTGDEKVSRIAGAFVNESEPDTIRIHGMKMSIDAKDLMSSINSSFSNVYPNWIRIERVSNFFQKSFNVSCFANEELKSVIILIVNPTNANMHFLQCAIPAYLPWYFDKEDGITDEEMQLFLSLRERSEAKYIDCINAFAEKYDFRSLKIKRLLAGFETRFERVEIDKVSNSIRDLDARIAEYQRYINDYLSRKREAEIRMLGLQCRLGDSGEGNSEIMDYFMLNKHVDLVNVTDSRMRFIVKDYLSFVNEDMVNAVLNNKRSFIYSHGNIPNEDMQMLIKSIFLDETLRIRTCAAYEFSIGSNVSALSGYGFPLEYSTYLPNPHIQGYSCMGNYSPIINKMIVEGDNIGAIEQCIASCKSLNFADTIVMNNFMETMSGRANFNKRFIETAEGEILSVSDAIAYLKKQNKDKQ